MDFIKWNVCRKKSKKLLATNWPTGNLFPVGQLFFWTSTANLLIIKNAEISAFSRILFIRPICKPVANRRVGYFYCLAAKCDGGMTNWQTLVYFILTRDTIH